MGHFSIYHCLVLSLILVLWVILPVVTARSTERKYAALKGIGGWLFILAVNLHIAFLALAVFLAQILRVGIFSTTILGISCICAVIMALAVWALVLLYRRSSRFPAVAIGYVLAAGSVTIVLPVWMMMGMKLEFGIDFGTTLSKLFRPEDAPGMVIPLIAGILWAAYIAMSRRVRNTFTRQAAPEPGVEGRAMA
jgi:hypothetical protein